jgi:hypothetical protein
MLTEDFYGKKGFVWWTGVVENTKDPLDIGSVQVRIIGLHPFLDESGLPNKTLLPTEKLPWAQVVLPTTGAKTTSGLREGDWVFGFFQDGDYAQMPIVMGMFPGIQGIQSQIVYNESVRIKTNPPRVPSDIVVRQVGEPTSARLARGVLEGTLVNRTNNQLESVCDVSNEVKILIGEVKVLVGTIMRAIKEAIRALLAALGLEPSGESRKLVQFLKEVTAAIREAVEFYEEEIKPYIDLVLTVARYLRAIISYILSLPERLAKFIRKCLAVFAQSIISQFSSIDTGSPLGSDFAELTNAISDLQDASKDLFASGAELLTAPAQFVEAIVNPGDPQKVLEVESFVSGYIEQNFQTQEQTKEEIMFNGSKGI